MEARLEVRRTKSRLDDDASGPIAVTIAVVRRHLPVFSAMALALLSVGFALARARGYFVGGAFDAAVSWLLRMVGWVPAWALLLVAAAMPLVWLFFAWRYRREWCRLREGRCGRCAYDLRASKGRRPECGEPVRAEYQTGIFRPKTR